MLEAQPRGERILQTFVVDRSRSRNETCVPGAEVELVVQSHVSLTSICVSYKVTNAETLHYRTQKPVKDGLFYKTIFGLILD
ncbi:hypothetical protein KDA_48360 [Dictyobacter alpinus]|uniref:Uncharacterized protein n=1 Tax=Dictyobacter alpinus TaxID=2014873 RepID=A0A402BDI3_9CHLR|nr:hypothetical protein [Dictyobacter alpinus]GCE29352.1 hypothetical protein KDA_48360 [Dictyobacter alpinus]